MDNKMMAGLLSILNASKEEYDGLADSIANSNGRAEEMAAIMRDNLKGDLTLAKSAVDGLAQSFGETLEPSARGLVQAFTGIIDKFMGLSETSKSTIIAITTIGTALGGLLLVAGTVTLTFGKMFTALGKTAIGMKLSVGITSITKGLKTMIPVLGASKLAMSAFTLGVGAIAVALVGLVIHLATAEKRLLEFNQKTIASMNESTEKIKANTNDLKSVREAYAEIDELQNKINSTSNSSEKVQLEQEMITKKQALIDLMPSVTEGMDAETTSQLELNKALDDYIKSKERENDLEQRKQRKEARDFINENKMTDGKASGTLQASLTAEKDIEYVEGQLDQLSRLDEKATLILANGDKTTVENHRKNLEARLDDSTKAYEKENLLLQQTYDAYSALDPKTLRPEQKAFMEEFEKYDMLLNDHKSILETIPELNFDPKRIQSSSKEIQALKEELSSSKEIFSSFSNDANTSFGDMIEHVDAGKMTVEDFREGLFEFESASKKAYGQNGALAQDSMDKVLKAFSKGELTVDEYGLTMQSTTALSEDSMRKLSSSGKTNMVQLMRTFEKGEIPVKDLAKSIELMSTYGSMEFDKLSKDGVQAMEDLSSGFATGEISVEDFEKAISVMSLYTAQDFSKLDKASQDTLNKLISKLPEGGDSARQLENAINGMTVRSSIDMSKLDQVTQDTINKIVSEFNNGQMSSQNFADAMNIMSVISQTGLENLDADTRNTISTLQSEFANGKVTADGFATGIMSAMGISGASLSQFTSAGQTQLLALISEFLQSKISAEKLQEGINALKTNPEFAKSVDTTMQTVSDSANEATGDVNEVTGSINAIPAKKTSTIEINRIETTTKKTITGNPITSGAVGGQKPISFNIGEAGNTANARSPVSTDISAKSPTVGLSPDNMMSESVNSNSRTAQTDEDRKLEEAARKQEQMEQDSIREIERLRNKLAEALRKKAEEQKEHELKLLDEKLNAIEKHYDKQKELLDKSINDRISALEKEKKSLNEEKEEDYQAKVNALKSELDMWKQNDSAYAKGKVKELEEKLKEAEKDLRNKQIDDEIEKLEEEQKAQEKILEEQQKAEIEALEKEKEAKEKYWEEQLSDKNIFLEANKIMLQGNMNEMLSLIETYAPEWDDIGLLFGESLADGIKRGIKDGLNAKDFMDGLKGDFEESKPSWWNQKSSSGTNTNKNNSSNNSSSPTNATDENANKKSKGKVVGTDKLNVREGAGTNHKQSGVLWRNEEIDILDEKNGWYYIDYYNAAKKSRQKGWGSGNYIQRFNTGGVIGDLGLNGGIAIVDSKERILTAQQTGTFDKLVYDWLPNLEDVMSKFKNIKTNENINNETTQNLNFYNTFNVTAKDKLDAEKLTDMVVKGIEDKARRFGVNLKPVSKVRVK